MLLNGWVFFIKERSSFVLTDWRPGSKQKINHCIYLTGTEASPVCEKRNRSSLRAFGKAYLADIVELSKQLVVEWLKKEKVRVRRKKTSGLDITPSNYSILVG